jgi:3'-5' exoribonuclease
VNQPTIAAVRKDDRFLGFLLVRMAEQRQSSKGDKYLDMTLGDATGDLNAKVWDGKATPPSVGTVVKVQATVQEYNGRLQLRVERLRAAQPQDEVDMSALTLCAPEPPESMLAEIYEAIDKMQCEDLKKILREMLSACGDKLTYYPAAQRLHHAERSGLLHHTVSMLRTAQALLPLYPFLDADLLLAGVIAHDLSKTAEMQSDMMGNVKDYSTEGLLLGHLVRGVTEVRLAADRAGVPIISSMGAGNKLDPSRFRVTDISKTSVCPLARAVRQALRKKGITRLKAVWSDEAPMAPAVLPDGEPLPPGKRSLPGSIVFVPAAAGLLIAAEVVRDLTREDV